MKESEIKSTVDHDVLRPSIEEFANFGFFIKTLEKKNISFALVRNFILVYFDLLFFNHIFYSFCTVFSI